MTGGYAAIGLRCLNRHAPLLRGSLTSTVLTSWGSAIGARHVSRWSLIGQHWLVTPFIDQVIGK